MFYEAKQKARYILKSRWGEAIVVLLIYAVISALLAAIGGIGTLLFSSTLLMGYYYCLIVASTTGKFKAENIFYGFTHGDLITKIAISVLKQIYTFLWGLLFVIPGIVKFYSYTLTEFIALKRPELSSNECISESRRIMNGHKMNLFLFDLSFIGWYILCLFTFGIGYLFLIPYVQQARIEYINENILSIKYIGE